MARLVCDGQKIQEVADSFGVSHETVRRACRENNVALRSHRLLKIKSLEVLADMLHTKLTDKEISAKRGLSVSAIQTLRGRAKASGIQFPEGRAGYASKKQATPTVS